MQTGVTTGNMNRVSGFSQCPQEKKWSMFINERLSLKDISISPDMCTDFRK